MRIVRSVAPMRICDNGGWTDTWFAGRGKVFNIAVSPCVHVEVRATDSPTVRGAPRFAVCAGNEELHHGLAHETVGAQEHPLLHAAVACAGLPPTIQLDVNVWSKVPAGCSTGTSAAVTVALVGALDVLKGGNLSRHDLAMAAYHVEANVLGRQCGVQDQLAAAYGGINYIEITNFPHAAVHQVTVSDSLERELERRLLLFFVGKSHNSSKVHEQVIARLQRSPPEVDALNALRAAAERSRDALLRGDFDALGRAMIDNTAAQVALSPALVGEAHQIAIRAAQAHGALGWKVNGAGGDGGSVTVLAEPDAKCQRGVIRGIKAACAAFEHIPIRICNSGIRCWEAVDNAGAR